MRRAVRRAGTAGGGRGAGSNREERLRGLRGAVTDCLDKLDRAAGMSPVLDEVTLVVREHLLARVEQPGGIRQTMVDARVDIAAFLDIISETSDVNARFRELGRQVFSYSLNRIFILEEGIRATRAIATEVTALLVVGEFADRKGEVSWPTLTAALVAAPAAPAGLPPARVAGAIAGAPPAGAAGAPPPGAGADFGGRFQQMNLG